MVIILETSWVFEHFYVDNLAMGCVPMETAKLL